MHPRGENQAKDTGGGIGADRKHGGQWSRHPSWSSIHTNKKKPSGTHNPRCNFGLKQAVIPIDRGPNGNPQQASTTTTSGKSFSLFSYADRGMPHMWRSTWARIMYIVQEDPSRDVNYMGIQNRHGFQGYNQGGPPRFNQGRNFTQGSSWRNHLGNQFNKEQRSQPAQNLNQGVDLHEKTNKLEETLN